MLKSDPNGPLAQKAAGMRGTLLDLLRYENLPLRLDVIEYRGYLLRWTPFRHAPGVDAVAGRWMAYKVARRSEVFLSGRDALEGDTMELARDRALAKLKQAIDAGKF